MPNELVLVALHFSLDIFYPLSSCILLHLSNTPAQLTPDIKDLPAFWQGAKGNDRL
jgi:hypothetical protein